MKAHSETLPEDRIQSSDEVAVEEETKKKKHRREKIGFRDRKVCFKNKNIYFCIQVWHPSLFPLYILKWKKV